MYFKEYHCITIVLFGALFVNDNKSLLVNIAFFQFHCLYGKMVHLKKKKNHLN